MHSLGGVWRRAPDGAEMFEYSGLRKRKLLDRNFCLGGRGKTGGEMLMRLWRGIDC